MEPDTKESTKKAGNMDRENTLTQMEQFTKVSGKRIGSLASENRAGLLAKFTMVSGLITTWKALGSTSTTTK